VNLFHETKRQGPLAEPTIEYLARTLTLTVK
jgi:hypothetical protein